MDEWLGRELAPDELWAIVEPLIPPQRERPQGGGTRYVDDRTVFTAIVYVLTAGCAWRHLPSSFGVSKATAHRRFTAWITGGPRPGWGGRCTGPCWTGSASEARSTGPGPCWIPPACGPQGGLADRPEPGGPGHTGLEAARPDRCRRAAAGRRGLGGQHPANVHDSQALIPLVQAIPAVRSRRGPRRRRPDKLHADKGYDYEHLRTWLRGRGIVPRIARRGVESSERLGRRRWRVERTLAWTTGYRRLTLRYERRGKLFAAFLALAAAITCYKNPPT